MAHKIVYRFNKHGSKFHCFDIFDDTGHCVKIFSGTDAEQAKAEAHAWVTTKEVSISSPLAVSLEARERLVKLVGLEEVWDNHPDHLKTNWQYEVANGDTTLGYIEWCAARIVNEAGELF